MKYMMDLPVGDYSGDGHERCEYVRILSNVPIKELTEMIRSERIRDHFGFAIDSLAGKYECCWYDECQTGRLFPILKRIVVDEETTEEHLRQWIEEWDGQFILFEGFRKPYRDHINVVLEMVREVFPEFKYQLVADVDRVWASCGGYGLFY